MYLVPASLYCLYNNLAFVSLSFFNPTTYFMLMQIRLLLTGLIYQVAVYMVLGIYYTLPEALKTSKDNLTRPPGPVLTDPKPETMGFPPSSHHWVIHTQKS